MYPMAFASALLLTLAGCTSSSSSQLAQAGMHVHGTGHAQHQKMHNNDMMAMCPMKIAGTEVAVRDTADGLSMVFTTSKGDVVALRERVGRMAKMHNEHHAKEHKMGAGMSQGKMKGKMGEGMHGYEGMMVAATATAAEVEGGGSITLVPKDPSKLAALREHARIMADQMQSGECPMMKKEESASAKQAPPTSSEDHAGHH